MATARASGSFSEKQVTCMHLHLQEARHKARGRLTPDEDDIETLGSILSLVETMKMSIARKIAGKNVQHAD